MIDRPPLPLAVLISGSGSTLNNLLELIERGELHARVRLVISSRADAGGLAYAAQRDIPTSVVRRKDYPDAETFRDAVFDPIRAANVALVVMGGYLQHVLIPLDFENRVVNIHPSLIPAFCGHGYYGLAVHRAAIEYGVKVSGCTVHFVDDHYDHGPIIAQQVCPVFPGDTAQSLQERVGQLERQLLPQVVEAIAEDRVRIAGDHRHVVTEPRAVT